MRRKKFLFLTTQQMVFLLYFILTTVFFYISLSQGDEGVSLAVFGGGDDGLFYWEQAQNIFSGGEAILTSIYPLIIGYLIKITGWKSVYLIRIFNYLGFVLFIYFSLRLVKIFYESDEKKQNLNYKIDDSKIIAVIMLSIYPSIIAYVNISIFRDIWIYLFYLICTILVIEMKKSNKRLNLHTLLFIPFLLLLGLFRRYALIVFIFANIIFFMYSQFKKRNKLLIMMIVMLVLSGIYYTFLKEVTIPVINMNLRGALGYRSLGLGQYAGGSQMMISLDQPTFVEFVINYCYSYIGNFIGPLPWQITGISTLITFFSESIIFLFMLIYLWRKRTFITNTQKYVLTHAFVWISFIAIINDNLGTATRLRVVAWVLIIIVFASNYPKYRNSK